MTAIAETTVPPKRDRIRPDASVRSILVVGFLALLGRIAYVLLVKRNDKDLFAEGDAFFYSTVANALGQGHFFRKIFGGHAADHPPLTVLVLGPASWLFPENHIAQRLTMAVIGAAAVIVIGLIGRAVAGNRAGIAAAIVAAIYPNLWVNDGLVMSESISALCTAGLMLAGCRLAKAPTMRRALIAGALCGLTVLARAEVGLLLPFMIWPILALAKDLPWRDKLGRMAAATVMTAVVIAPWTLYNLSQYPETVLISVNDGTVVRGAYCDDTFPDGRIPGSWSLGCVLDATEDGTEPSLASKLQRKQGLRYAGEHLSEIPEVMVLRAGRTFGYYKPAESVYANQGEGRKRWISWLCWWTFWGAVPLSAVGLVVLRRRGATLWPFVAPVIVTVAITVFLYGLPRFRLPMEVAIAVLIGVAVDAGLNRAKRRVGQPT